MLGYFIYICGSGKKKKNGREEGVEESKKTDFIREMKRFGEIVIHGGGHKKKKDKRIKVEDRKQ